MAVKGFDLSNNNGVFSVDQFRQARADGWAFMYHKVTDGDTFDDVCYPQNKANAQEADILVGGYHFAEFRELDMQDGFREALHFLKHVGSLEGMLPSMLDDEVGTGDHTTAALAWLNLVAFLTGCTQEGLYSYGSFFRSHYDAAKVQVYLEWLAQYGTWNPTPPPGWDRPDIHQLTDKANVPGIGVCDGNLFEGELAQLQALVFHHFHAPDDPAAVAEIMFPNGSGGWRVHADGGVFVVGNAPFYGSYPGLPPESRQGDRTFVGIEARGDGTPGYVLVSNHNERYVFP